MPGVYTKDGAVNLDLTGGHGVYSNSGGANLSGLLTPQKWIGFGQRGIGFTGDGNTDAVNNSFNNWNVFFIPTGVSFRALRIVWSQCDITASGETNRAVAITGFTASIVCNNIVYPLTFNGAPSTTINPGRGLIKSDPIWINTGTATQVIIRSFGNWSGTLTLGSTNQGTVTLTGEGCNQGTGLTDRTQDAYNAAAPANSGGGYFPPIAVLGLPTKNTAVVGLLTDSHGKGTGDTTGGTAGYGWKGYIMRSLQNSVPWVYTGRGGAYLNYNVTRDDGVRSVLQESGITHLVLAMVTNDVWIGRSLTQILADIQTISDYYRPYGVKTYITTCPPRTTGTYTSAAGQTLYDGTAEVVRLAYNESVRASWRDQGHSGLIDMASVIEDPAATGKWLSSGGFARTSDGVHANDSGISNLISSNIITPALFSL